MGIFNQQPMGFYNLETLKEDARRHQVRILNPDINKSQAKCIIEDEAVRLGFLNVLGLGEAAAKGIEEGRAERGGFQKHRGLSGTQRGIGGGGNQPGGRGSLRQPGSPRERTGEGPNRRKVKWEIGLSYRPVNSQLFLPLPVEQDLVELEAPSEWESMKEEYNVLSLFPAGHIMASLRPRFKDKEMCCSKDIAQLRDGAEVMTAGLVIRRQRPLGKVVFITLEDEFGHIPCMVFPQVYERQEHKFKSPFLIVKGRLTRREGTHNVVVTQVKPFNALSKVPQSKDWR